MCRVTSQFANSADRGGAGLLARACGLALLLCLTLAASQVQAGGRGPRSKPAAAQTASQDAINGALAAVSANPVAPASSAMPARPLESAKPPVRPQDIGLRAGSAGGEILALGARVTVSEGTTLLSVDLSAPVNVTAFVLAEPDRIIVELPETAFHIAEDAGRLAHPEGLIRAFRFGQFAAGKSRMVIDLAGPARIVKASSARLAAGDPARLAIVLAAETPANFAAAAARAAAAEASAVRHVRPAAATAVATAKPVIVIDPGHGGIDSGAAGQAGATPTTEKSIVFEFSRVLAQKLEASKRYRVILTRDTDVFVTLDERVRIARESHAALFLSVHADTISDSADVNGATVYTVAERASDIESARTAEKENGADLVAGVTAKEEISDVSDILFDLTRRETRAYSHGFARQLTGAWAGAARLNKNPERAAGFRVLRAPDVPSVLLELGFLSNDRDARSMVSLEWRERASASVVRAIDQFFAPRLVLDEPDEPLVDPLATGSIGPSVLQTPQSYGN